MQGWLLGKLDRITDEFLQGEGSTVAYEAQYLAYLECLAAVWHGPDKAGSMWDEYRKYLAAGTPGVPPQALSATMHDRPAIAAELRVFHKRYAGMFPRRFNPTPLAQPEVDTRSEDEGLGLFDLLSPAEDDS